MFLCFVGEVCVFGLGRNGMDISISEEPLHGSGDGDDDLLVHSRKADGSFFFHHPDDGEGFALDFDDEAQGRAVAEEFLGDLVAEDGDVGFGFDVASGKESAMFDVIGTNLGVLRHGSQDGSLGVFIEELDRGDAHDFGCGSDDGGTLRGDGVGIVDGQGLDFADLPATLAFGAREDLKDV